LLRKKENNCTEQNKMRIKFPGIEKEMKRERNRGRRAMRICSEL
jgi:hypothetical protein